jgi:hypothetical protein
VQTKFTKLVFNGTQNCLLVHLLKIFLKPIFVRETLLVVSLIVPLNLKWRNFFIKFSFLYCFEVESFFESEFIFVLLLLNSIVFMWIKKIIYICKDLHSAAFQLTFIQTFRKYLGAFNKVEEYTHNHQTNNTYQNVVPQTLFPTLTFLLK